ncbi:MAG TPA: DUF4292 domain-containing protein, partial [Draconibacterium sp.]|nr:DUF4292 domain-containing protein [Draconibacterium sp.]
ENKAERILKRLDDNALIVQKMYFNPDNFALNRVAINDISNDRSMRLDFDDFTKVEKKEYPGSIDINFISPEEEISMKINMSGFSTEKITSFNIKIPEKYEEIRVN